jgi:hypothetical protein
MINFTTEEILSIKKAIRYYCGGGGCGCCCNSCNICNMKEILTKIEKSKKTFNEI